MNRVAFKKFLIFKSHLLPQIQKPLTKMHEFLMFKNNDLDPLKAKKMSKMLDDQQFRKLKHQRNFQNEKINQQIQNYYKRYIQPMEECPDYFKSLFLYSLIKSRYFIRNRQKIEFSDQQPFHITKHQFRQIYTQYKREKRVSQKFSLNFLQLQQNPSKNQQTKTEQKIMVQVYRSLSPFQKVQMLKKFKKQYSQFLASHQNIIQEILKENISLVQPFILFSPAEIHQSKNSQLKLKECQQIVNKDPILRKKLNQQLLKLLQKRKKELTTLADRHKISIIDINKAFRKQYYKSQFENSFYQMLKYKE